MSTRESSPFSFWAGSVTLQTSLIETVSSFPYVEELRKSSLMPRKAHGSSHAKCHIMQYHEHLVCFAPASIASSSKHAFILPFPILVRQPIMLQHPCSFVIAKLGLPLHPESANPILRRYSPDIHLRQKPSQLPETSRLSYRANCRQGTGECRYHLAFSAETRGERGDRSSRQLRLGRRSSGARTGAGSA